jgi:phosphatidylserine decarboxylase
VPDSIFVFIQHWLPKRLLTELMGSLARHQGGSLTHWAIAKFINRYKVNMSEALNSDHTSYATFNDFFTRPLKPGLRPIADQAWVCPVDGALSQAGPIQTQQIFQAKGHSYSAQALLGGDANLGQRFENGHFATIYLSPRDYHRLHMPCDGRLVKVIYVPGDLYSVNPATARGVPGLFARNERVVCLFEHPKDDKRQFALVLVGATIVGSIGTVWTGAVNRTGKFNGAIDITPTPEQTLAPFEIKKGAEMGRFLLGSTIVMVDQTSLKSPWPLLANATEGLPVKLGQAI